MKTATKFLFAILLTFGIAGLAQADTAIHLTISTNSDSIYDSDSTVTPCDSDNDPATPDLATAYCAIVQSGIQNAWDWSWPPGAFLTSLNNISGFTTTDADGNPVYHYWSWSANGSEGMTGLNQYDLVAGDLITLTFIDPLPPPPPPPVSSGGGGSGSYFPIPVVFEKKVFDTKKAYEYLLSQQKENGSFGESLYTDWSALALAGAEDRVAQKEKLMGHLKGILPEGGSLTDTERHAMALMALGINPYEVNGENYIKKITDSWDGKQFGNPAEDNDDIFALIVLQNAGYSMADKIITDDVSFILSRQKDNGSWDGNVDMTGAVMEALAVFSEKNSLFGGVSQADGPRASVSLPAGADSDLKKEEFYSEINNSLAHAKEYLKQNQGTDGGWQNVSSTAWAMQGIMALGEKPSDWIVSGNSPLDYLANAQDPDGGIKDSVSENRIWQTAYVLSPLSGKTWNEVMQKFEKPAEAPAQEMSKGIFDTKLETHLKISKEKLVPLEQTEDTIAPAPEPTHKQGWLRFLGFVFGF